MIRVLVFDFDGVLINSNEIKHNAFFHMFPDDDQEMHAIVEKILKKGKKDTRYEIFRKTYKDLKNPQVSEKNFVEKNVKKYNTLVQEELKKLDVIDGVLEMLENLQKSYILYINTTTPTDAMLETAQSLDITKYFKKIYGSPEKKAENLRDIMKSENINKDEMLMIGDGINDFEAAQEIGCRFLRLKNSYNDWTSSIDFKTFNNILDLPKILNQL